MKVLDFEGLKQLVSKIKKMLNKKVDKIDGKSLSTNDFTNEDKEKLYSNNRIIQGDNIYDINITVENGKPYIETNHIGKLIANDFLKVNINGDSYKFSAKSTSKGVILFYSMIDEALRYAIHVYPQIKDYEIDFGKKVTGEMIFTTVTMPEDKVSIVREEGLNVN